MLRSLPRLRKTCKACKILPWNVSNRCSSSNDDSKGAVTDGPVEQLSENESQEKRETGDSIQGKKVASEEEVKSKLSSLLSSLKVQARVGENDKQDLKLASYQLRQIRRPVPLPASKQALKGRFQAVGPKMAKAVEAVAEEVGGGEETEKELLDSLERVSSEPTRSSSSEAQGSSPEALGKLKDTLSNLSVEKRRSRHTSRRSTKISVGLSLFEAQPLNIFPPVDDPSVSPPSAPLLPTWEAQVARDLSLCTSRPADSPFQELLRWTEQGKIWQFPINNELGMEMEAESKVGFQDHIFLERHLSPWCPKKGPIAHFMELVCVGLSKNPYITAQRKKETILWYRDYFESKKKLLEEIGAIEAKTTSGEQKKA